MTRLYILSKAVGYRHYAGTVDNSESLSDAFARIGIEVDKAVFADGAVITTDRFGAPISSYLEGDDHIIIAEPSDANAIDLRTGRLICKNGGNADGRT